MMLFAGAVMLISCNTKDRQAKTMKDLALLDEKVADGWNMRLRYLPSKSNDTAAWTLVLHAEHDSRLPQQQLNEMRFSYGIDSLFEVIAGTDTIVPLLAMRVATGQSFGAEYMLTFDRRALAHAGAVQLRFKDWLFSRRDLYFPLNVVSIHQLDSIFSRI